MKFWAGAGIRTLAPNLGKDDIAVRFGAPPSLNTSGAIPDSN